MIEGKRGWLLAGCLFLSLAVHAAAVYLIQVAYPPPAALAPPPPEVSLLDLTNPANKALRGWIEAQDPARIHASRESAPMRLVEFPYQPSYAGMTSVPKPDPEEPLPLRAPPARDLAGLISLPEAPSRDTAPAPASSRILFTGPLAKRGTGGPGGRGEAGALSPRSATLLEPARFLIGVTGEGEARFCFLQRSSGDKAVDDKAEAFLLQMHFAPAAAALEWGVASFFWGNDAYAKP